MNAKRLIMTTLAVLALALLSVTARGADPVLEIGSSHKVSGTDILLRELVSNASTLPDGWADRVVMRSPEPGKPEQFSLTSVAYALQRYPDMHEVTLRGSMKFTVERVGETLSIRTLSKAIQDYVNSSEEWKGKRIKVVCDPAKKSLIIPEGKYDISILAAVPEKRHGYYLFSTIITPEKGKEITTPVSAKLVLLETIWVAKSAMKRGHVISKSDIETREVPQNAARGYVHSSEDIAGMELNRSVKNGEALIDNMITQPLCASRGDMISVNAKRGALAIRLRAIAMATGRKGERILCHNSQSKRRILVRLTGTREATLDF